MPSWNCWITCCRRWSSGFRVTARAGLRATRLWRRLPDSEVDPRGLAAWRNGTFSCRSPNRMRDLAAGSLWTARFWRPSGRYRLPMPPRLGTWRRPMPGCSSEHRYRISPRARRKRWARGFTRSGSGPTGRPSRPGWVPAKNGSWSWPRRARSCSTCPGNCGARPAATVSAPIRPGACAAFPGAIGRRPRRPSRCGPDPCGFSTWSVRRPTNRCSITSAKRKCRCGR
jgi:hypothetical protein